MWPEQFFTRIRTARVSPRRFLNPNALALTSTLLIAACSSDSPSSPWAASLGLTTAPTIRLSPTSIGLCVPLNGRDAVRGCLPSASLNIINGGGGTLNWTATKNRRWFKIDPKTGTAPSSMRVSANDVTGLLRNHYYYGSITISGTGASNSPRTLPVSIVRRW